MKKRFNAMRLNCFLFILTLFLSSVSVFSQSKFGDATMEELNMSTYEKDTTASAVILLKKGDTRFTYNQTNGFQYEYSVQVKIKILKNEGLDLCNQSISFIEVNTSNKERISGLSGTTYNLEDGKITKTKLSKEFITDQDNDDFWKLKKFTMPAAKVGSVVEFKYTIISDFYMYLRDFEFQSSVPVIYTSYEVKIPEYFRFSLNNQGYEAIRNERKDEYESFLVNYRDQNGHSRSENIRCSALKYFFEGKDIPALKKEPYMWTTKDYITKVSFEIQSTQFPYSTLKSYTQTWADIDKMLMDRESFGSNLKKAGLFKNEIESSEATLERATEIQNLIKDKVKWNEKKGFYPNDLKKVLKDGIGSSSDINFLLINALKAGGFSAFPVVLSTRENGNLPLTHPSLEALDYVITGVQVGDNMYFTDASSKFGDWNILPEKCMVTKGRILKPNGSDWVDLSVISSGSKLLMCQYNYSDSTLDKKVTESFKGNNAYDFRNSYYSYKDADTYIENLASKFSGEIEDFKTSNLDKTNETVKVEFTVKSDFSNEDEYIYLNPMVQKYLSENPFKEENRIYPINLDYLESYIQIADINIPDGYEVEELPKSEKFVFGDNDITLTYRISAVENQIKFNYQLMFKKLLFLPAEYSAIQDFFSKIVAKGSEQIVLKKKTDIAAN